MKDIPTCRVFRYRYWTLAKNSGHLNNFAKGQNEQKSKQMNFQPLKVDFYLSNPRKKIDGKLIIHSDRTEFIIDTFNLDNEEPDEIPDKFKNITSESVIESKTFGKERGVTNRSDINQ